MKSSKKLGEIYEDWEQLERLPDHDSWEELVKKFPNINKDTLFVFCDRGEFEQGEIIKFKKNDGTKRPHFTNGEKDFWLDFDEVALLPAETEAAEKLEDNSKQFTVGSKQLEGALEELEKKGWGLSNLILQEGDACSTATLTVKRSFEKVFN